MRTRALPILLLLLVAAAGPVGAGDGPPATAPATWRAEVLDARMPMRDGAALAADVYLPAKPGRYPCVLVQTPYDKNRMQRLIRDPARPVGAVARGAASDLAVLLDREHYAIVVVDWRGFFGSRGALRGKPRRARDGYDCVEWCAARPWCNGRVGTWGGSALGKQQFQTATERPPHLVCCVPLIAAMGQVYEAFYDGGVPLGAHLKTLDALGFGVSRLVRRAPHPNQRIWNVVRRQTVRPDLVQVPCLLITGWWDNYPDLVIETFEGVVASGGPAARAHSRLLIGPWDHVSVGVPEQGDLSFPGAALASGHAAKAFLDLHLRGIPDEKGLLKARVRYWTAGEEGWREADDWRSIPRVSRPLHLHADGRILHTAPPAASASAPLTRRYRYDPRSPPPTLGGANLPPLPHGPRRQESLDRRADVLRYETAPLERALALNGNATLSLTFSCDRPDVDLFARLCDVHPDGDAAYLVGDAAVRAKLATGRPRRLEPGRPTRVTLRWPATAVTFAPGHRIRVYVSSGNAPRYEPNPHTGADTWDRARAVPAEVTIHHDARWPARLTLPVRAD